MKTVERKINATILTSECGGYCGEECPLENGGQCTFGWPTPTENYPDEPSLIRLEACKAAERTAVPSVTAQDYRVVYDMIDDVRRIGEITNKKLDELLEDKP